MPTTYTPLRYPGGKTKLYADIQPLLKHVGGNNAIYVEPFAGGAGLALKLLFCGDVKSIILNDIDRNVFLFWKACLEQTEDLCSLVNNAELSINEWERQKDILINVLHHSGLERCFALFYLNRCNRSGIIKGGPIGGKDQTGKYKIDARFNKPDLIRKIRAIGRRRADISVYCMDGKDFLNNNCSALPVDNTFINIDPPYVNKGPELYQNSFTAKDHIELSNAIKKLKQTWVVTYDIDDLIKSLYKKYSIREISLGYSAGSKRKTGIEYLITNIKGR